MCSATDANKVNGGKKRVSCETKNATRYVPAPEREEGKLLIVRNACWNRNKFQELPYHFISCDKPNGLVNLSDELFIEFSKDVQLSMQSHWTNYWHILIDMVIVSMIIVVVVPLFMPLVYVGYYGAACVLVTSLLALGNHSNLKDLQSEIEVRIYEWESQFDDEGFAVKYVVDKSCWTPTETYIHIFKTSPRKNASGVMLWDDRKQEAKFLLLFARLFGHRNNTFRVVQQSKEIPKGVYAKPPALHGLDDDVFQKLMQEIGEAVHSFARKKRNINGFLFTVFSIPILLWSQGWCAPLIAGLVILLLLIDQFLSDHLFFRRSRINKTIKEWKPRLKRRGFAIEYRVDKPAWYSWKEGYVHICHHTIGFAV